ncbi:hypothetical protein [Caballeronia sp. BR00000012568055]|uniref:hypothetical protein n=1 Tax=Caballeronia sp. BR00000012568055 TaxID=2918761 RepID=UPI0023FA3E78|nr:hypothetical protein [Caballeronia sp. BR00000012568055]
MHDAERRGNYLQKQRERNRQFVIGPGYHAASSRFVVLATRKIAMMKIRRKWRSGT